MYDRGLETYNRVLCVRGYTAIIWSRLSSLEIRVEAVQLSAFAL